MCNFFAEPTQSLGIHTRWWECCYNVLPFLSGRRSALYLIIKHFLKKVNIKPYFLRGYCKICLISKLILEGIIVWIYIVFWKLFYLSWGFWLFKIKVVDNVGQILTCWIFAYSDSNNRAMLMYFISAPSPLFLWYIEQRALALVLGHSLNCLSKSKFLPYIAV